MKKRHLAGALALVAVCVQAVWSQDQGVPVANRPAAGDERPELVLDSAGFCTSVSDLGFSPDGRLLAAAGSDKTVRVWELPKGDLRATLRGQRGVGGFGECTSLAFGPGGRELVLGVNDFSTEGTLRVYKTEDLGRIAELLPVHPRGVTAVEFSEDGKYLASAGADGKLLVWDWPARKTRFEVAVKDRARYIGFPFNGIPILVLIDAGGPSIWSVLHGKPVNTLGPPEIQALFGGDKPDAIAGFAQRMMATLGAFGEMKMPYGGQELRMRLYLDTGHIVAAGKATKDGADRYWAALWSNTHGPQPARLYEGHAYIPTAIALDRDRALIASADFLGDIHVWEAATGKRRLLLAGGGRPIYRVGFDESGKALGFGSKAFPSGRWNYNNYAAPDQTFDLASRRLSDGASGAHRGEVIRLGDRSLELQLDAKGIFKLVCNRAGRPAGRLPIEHMVMCYSLLRSVGPGFAAPIAIGRDDALAECLDPSTMLSRRIFAGHLGAVTSLSESPDGRFLATSSTDRTVRIWSLENFHPNGLPDFNTNFRTGVVNYVVPGGLAARAGVAVGDRWLRMDDVPVLALVNRFAEGRWDYAPGRRVRLDMERAGKPYRVEVDLVAGGDVASPLLNLFVDGDEWVLWTPQGYYDASLGGDRLIGWHINQGTARAAKFYTAHQFRKRFYRPDVIDRVLQAGAVDRALALADAERVRPTEALDLRRVDTLTRLEPPAVRILEPAEGKTTKVDRLTLRAEVVAQNDLPIGEVTVLVNGRPAPGREARAAADDTPRRRTIVREVELVPGENRIAVVAANEASSSQPATVAVTYKAAQDRRAKPNLYILAVGISEYAQKDLNLQFAHRDAEEFAAAWKSQQGPVYEAVESRVLTNEKATAAAIRDGMDWLVKSVTQHDLAILFFSAHGMYDTRRNFYLATHDIDADRLRSTAIPYSDVSRLIQDLPCKVLLFVDTCHSGGVTGAKGIGDDPLRELVSESVGTVVFASSTPREVSLEHQRWQHGAFTRALLDSFASPESDLDHDGYLGLTEMDFQIARRVKELTKGQQHPVTQKPPTIGDFNFYKIEKADAGAPAR